MKIGIMGGTFDPIHLGHLIVAEQARAEAGLDEVWFMPTYVPPHKPTQPVASSQERLHMVKLAVQSNPYFHPNDYELVKGGTSYSIDTITQLQERYPHDEFYYIIGADMVMYLPYWHKIIELAEKVTFIGVGRPGYPINLSELAPSLQQNIQLVSMPLVEISSTDIRGRCRQRKSIRYMVSEPVRAYMEENKLYEA